MKIGIVPYLNAVPFMGDGKVNNNSFDFVSDVPSKLSRLLKAGTIDAGLIPVFDYLNGTGKVILPHLSLSCKGPVKSVKLFYQPPLKDVKRIYADKASSTSAALVRILLKEIYGIEPKIFKVPAYYLTVGVGFIRPTGLDKSSPHCISGTVPYTGILHIGNLAFRKIKGYRELDLGEAWYKWTHMPFVFALWVINDKKNAREIGRLLNDNLEWTRKNIDAVSIQNARHLNLKKEFIKRYLTKSIFYSLGKRHINAIEKFQDLCLKHRLLKTKRHIEFVDE